MPRIENTEENQAKIEAVAESLLGTCNNLDDALETQFGEGVSLTDVDMALLDKLDGTTMQCEECNWWCETGELNDDQVCSDCVRDA